tara:strand:+ start:3699 stop:3908 length:210 start_codon:yes stop_codon:yes gene_type:complete
MNNHPSIRSINSPNPFSMRGTLLDFNKVQPGIHNLNEIHTGDVILPESLKKKSRANANVVKITPIYDQK